MSPHLSLDIQLEIIKRLPIKSLIRFRSVCKPWKSFIDSSEFITGYTVPQNQPQHLLMKYEVRDFKCVCFVDDDTFPQQMFTPTVPPLLEHLNLWRIIDESHGVLSFYDFNPQKPWGHWRDSVSDMVLLWNPSIRKSTAVVVPDLGYVASEIGFGVCPHTCDPMLVYIGFVDVATDPNEINCIPSRVMVFTLSSGGWSTLCCILPRESIVFTLSSTSVGRFIYWFAFDAIDDFRVNNRNLIMSFDMVSNEFIEIDLPDSLAHFTQRDTVTMPEISFSVSRLNDA